MQGGFGAFVASKSTEDNAPCFSASPASLLAPERIAAMSLPPAPPELLDQPFHLERPWTWWCDKYHGAGQSAEQYESSMYMITTFNTVQSFWTWYNNLPSVSKLLPRTSYHLMAEGVRPLWEDAANIQGGNLSLKVAKKDTPMVWMYLVLAMIGEQFDPALSPDDALCGISCSIRRTEDVVVVWNKNAEHFNTEALVGHLQQCLLPQRTEFLSVQYRCHSDLVHGSGTH
jgi:translation initiation factor 4E